MKSSKQPVAAASNAPRIRVALETTGDVRRALANTIKAVMNGDIQSNDAMTVIKGCEQMNNSLYAEIKYMAMLVAIGQQPAGLGELPMFGKSTENAA
jgi:hypothetical protein